LLLIVGSPLCGSLQALIILLAEAMTSLRKWCEIVAYGWVCLILALYLIQFEEILVALLSSIRNF